MTPLAWLKLRGTNSTLEAVSAGYGGVSVGTCSIVMRSLPDGITRVGLLILSSLVIKFFTGISFFQ
jgi:hypothetical protein